MPSILSSARAPTFAGGVIVLAHAPSFTWPLLDSDEACYASIAALLQDGGRLYAEGGVDNKFPGIYVTYAAVFALFGRYAMPAVHALALLVVLATSAALGVAAARLGGRRAGLLAASLYGLLTTFFYPKMLAANTELFMMLPLSAAALLLVARPPSAGRLLAAGACVGAATLFRQLAALLVPLGCLALLVCGGGGARRLARAFAPALGFAAVIAPALAWLATQGTLDDFWFWTVTASTTRYLVDGWSYAWPWSQLMGTLGVTLAPWALALLRAVRGRLAPRRELLLWLWLLAGVLEVALLQRFHPHYIIHAAGPLSILAALELDERRAQRRLVRVATALVALPAVAAFVVALLLDPMGDGVGRPRRDLAAVAREIRALTTAEQRIFVWGASGALYVLSNRLPATRFVGFLRGCPRDVVPLDGCWDTGGETWPLLEADLRRTPPELIVDTSPADHSGFAAVPLRAAEVLRELVETRYELATVVDGVHLYRRR